MDFPVETRPGPIVASRKVDLSHLDDLVKSGGNPFVELHVVHSPTPW